MSKSFGEVITSVAQQKAEKLSEKEYIDYLCELSDSFAIIDDED